MNERIERLAKQAEQYVKSNPKANVTIHGGDMFNKKFAELLIQECIEQILNRSMNSNDEWEDGLCMAKRAIEEHFGIEEN